MASIKGRGLKQGEDVNCGEFIEESVLGELLAVLLHLYSLSESSVIKKNNFFGIQFTLKWC